MMKVSRNIRLTKAKVSAILLLLFVSLVMVWNKVAEAGETCTHGKLYISDNASSTVHIFDLDGSLQNMAESTITIPNAGPELYFELSPSGKAVAAIYFGSKDKFYSDGTIHWIDTNVTVVDGEDHIEFGEPALISNVAIECTLPTHLIRHKNRIGVFCDGSYDATPQQINSTIWLIDESKFSSSSESAIIFNMTVQGSHHGWVLPVDDGHILHTAAAPERISRNDTEGAFELSTTFHVLNYNGDFIAAIDTTNSSNTSCSNFHGSWNYDNVIIFPGDSGLLKLDYDTTTSTFSSRLLAYPESFTSNRTYGLLGHPKSQYIVGDVYSEDMYTLISFQDTDSTLSESQVLSLKEGHCAYGIELAEGELILVLLPNGMLHVYKLDPKWNEIVSTQVVQGMVSCEEATFVSGYLQAFVLHFESKTLYVIDLDEILDNKVVVTNTTLSFTPSFAIVGGVPIDYGCIYDSHNRSGHDHDGEYEGTDGSEDSEDGSEDSEDSNEENEANGGASSMAFHLGISTPDSGISYIVGFMLVSSLQLLLMGVY